MTTDQPCKLQLYTYIVLWKLSIICLIGRANIVLQNLYDSYIIFKLQKPLMLNNGRLQCQAADRISADMLGPSEAQGPVTVHPIIDGPGVWKQMTQHCEIIY